jgi:hypothetical protein
MIADDIDIIGQEPLDDPPLLPVVARGPLASRSHGLLGEGPTRPVSRLSCGLPLTHGVLRKLLAVKNPKRVINLALIVVAVIAVVAAVVAAKSGGKSANTGNAQACNAFWTWYDGTGGSNSTLTAYQHATTQPLIADLYNVSVGLQDKAKGLNGNKAANSSFANSAANNVVTDCTNAGYPDPAS